MPGPMVWPGDAVDDTPDAETPRHRFPMIFDMEAALRQRRCSRADIRVTPDVRHRVKTTSNCRLSDRSRRLLKQNVIRRSYATTLAQWLHLVAADGRSDDRHSGQVLVGAGGSGEPNTFLPCFAMYER